MPSVRGNQPDFIHHHCTHFKVHCHHMLVAPGSLCILIAKHADMGVASIFTSLPMLNKNFIASCNTRANLKGVVL